MGQGDIGIEGLHCRVQVARWRERYVEFGLEGIERDLPRGAPPVKVDLQKLVELTTLASRCDPTGLPPSLHRWPPGDGPCGIQTSQGPPRWPLSIQTSQGPPRWPLLTVQALA